MADFHERRNIRIHVPEGVIPKDDPSAGIGIHMTLVSAITQILVCTGVATIGEITLYRQVLMISGLKGKPLAAHRGGIRTVIIPKENIRDLKKIPDNIRSDLVIRPVKQTDEIL